MHCMTRKERNERIEYAVLIALGKVEIDHRDLPRAAKEIAAFVERELNRRDSLFIRRCRAESRSKNIRKRSAPLSKLKAEMVAAHPDKGGTNAAFIQARRRFVEARRGRRRAA
jgi:hypothetical protein